MVGSFGLGALELGVATAATQIEGGNADTNWHAWALTPGHIVDGSSPSRAADHWNRVADDTALLARMGIKHYRMGLEWARVEPHPGEFDEEAIAHYVEELRGLLAAGIRPLATLHHFNNPMWFEELGGFASPKAVAIFTRYAEHMVTALRDLVSEWITINEPNIYATHAYLFGTWPPGKRSVRTLLKVFTNLAVAHIQAYELIHELQPEAKVGVANHLRVFEPLRSWNPLHKVSAWGMAYLFQDAITRAMSVGRFLAPFTQPKGLKPGQYYDFQGINYYSRSTVRSFADGTAKRVPINDLGWEIYPQGIVDVATAINARYPGPIYITENGTADTTDAFRSRFLYEHLQALVRSELPVVRYYHWCFTDNWEWLEGESARFGLVHLDYETQTRQVKASGRFYSDMIANNGVTSRAYDTYVASSEYRTNA